MENKKFYPDVTLESIAKEMNQKLFDAMPMMMKKACISEDGIVLLPNNAIEHSIIPWDTYAAKYGKYLVVAQVYQNNERGIFVFIY